MDFSFNQFKNQNLPQSISYYHLNACKKMYRDPLRLNSMALRRHCFQIALLSLNHLQISFDQGHSRYLLPILLRTCFHQSRAFDHFRVSHLQNNHPYKYCQFSKYKHLFHALGHFCNLLDKYYNLSDFFKTSIFPRHVFCLD